MDPALCFSAAGFTPRLNPDMPSWVFPVLVFGSMIVMIGLVAYFDNREARRLRTRTIVEPLKKYPNNHHVMGVGYYHAAHQRWHATPWNEFREGQGYYWDGEWHETPDDRQIPESTPGAAELHRVNEAWRRAGPQRVSEFWKDVERFGFGTAIGRRTGS